MTDIYAEGHGVYVKGPAIDDPEGGQRYQRVHPDMARALWRRFDGGSASVWHPDKPGVILSNIENWWDGPFKVTHIGGGVMEYTSPCSGELDRFCVDGYYDRGGNLLPWSD